MKFFQDCWIVFLSIFGAPLDELPWGNDQQTPLTPTYKLRPVGGGPTFPAPNSPEDDQFQCDYSAMGHEWTPCSTEENRRCWLRHTNGTEFNITSDYENLWPTGIVRDYELNVTRKYLNNDGVGMEWGKVFNDQYPGPWIQACWGDTIRVKVNNFLEWNGTTIHWHGLRMWKTMQNDGVNGVTQCPIAPNSSFTYTFTATQYGTTWYHSHYSLQYADGMLGPLTLYGPSSAKYDHSKKPTLMTDWNHRSAFEDFSKSQFFPSAGPAKMDSILLNGIGNYAGVAKGGLKYTISFVEGKRYLMRLINTSSETTFVFMIDGHELEVMSSDFVSIHPYKTDHVVIGIGQRYHVVVEAKEFPLGANLTEKNYWIRTIPAEKCSSFERGNTPDERQGILRYNNESTVTPTGERKNISITCRDEPYEKLRPILPWTVADPVNDWKEDNNGTFIVGIDGPNHEKPMMYGRFSRWALGKDPLWLNFSDPTALNLGNEDGWDPKLVVIPENFDDNDWVYLVITAHPANETLVGRSFNAAAHPIHLHGHDFALLQQSTDPYKGPNSLKLKTNNPPRRDVVLLPNNGFVVIAFKTDNPGAWLIHCHIPFHASSGLAMQILERQKDIQKTFLPGWLDQVELGCREWHQWFSNPKNLWDEDYEWFQDDSGI